MKFNFPKYDNDWIELSRKCKNRDSNKCTRCGKVKEKLHAHHIISKSKGGRDCLKNLRTLCRECHMLKHSHMKRRFLLENNCKKKTKTF